jgi:hypothetical protein
MNQPPWQTTSDFHAAITKATKAFEAPRQPVF